MSAPAFMRKSATSENPPQQAKVRAVSCVSSVCAFILAPMTQIKQEQKLTAPRFHLAVTFISRDCILQT